MLYRNHTNKQAGFTAVELITVLAASAVVATLAVSTYTDQNRKARRADATAHLAALVQQEEMFFTRNRGYTSVISGADGCAGAGCGLNQTTALSPNEFYAISAVADARTYTLTATAREQQIKDKQCRSFTINNAGIRTASSASGADTTDICW